MNNQYKSLQELSFGFSDASNYRRRENKQFFSKVFLKNEALEEIKNPSKYFIIGDKGTGKTAYAVYLSNNSPNHSIFNIKFIRETDYRQFINIRKANALQISDYVDIWKTILLMICSDSIREHESSVPFSEKRRAFADLQKAIDEYYKNAFSPEVTYALQAVENSEDFIKVAAKYAGTNLEYSSKEQNSEKSERSIFQLNLLQIERSLKNSIAKLNLAKNHTIFIDGIDVRPEQIPFSEYLDCVKGLANAIWQLNNDFFPSVRDSKGRLKVVLLLRPDIFDSLGLQNRNTKIKDNSVVLNWKAHYKSYRNSSIFQMADKVLSEQQEFESRPSFSFDHYFPFNTTKISDKHENFTAFISFLRNSFHRPRDIIAIYDTLAKLFVRKEEVLESFSFDNLNSSEFRRAFGSYLLGEVKDSLSFYYSDAEYQIFLKFFEYLDGHKSFDYGKYLAAYANLMRYLKNQGTEPPGFMSSAEEFLQFLYDLNVLCYIEHSEQEKFFRWCFIERDMTNISPKVKTHSNYEIHYALANALNTGKKIKSRKIGGGLEVKKAKDGFFEGCIKSDLSKKSYGFIEQDGMPIDIFYHRDNVITSEEMPVGQRVRFRLEKNKGGKLQAVDVMVVKDG